MINLIEKIVFSGADGRVLIIPLVILIYVAIGQVVEFVDMAREIWKEGESDGLEHESPNQRRRTSQKQL